MNHPVPSAIHLGGLLKNLLHRSWDAGRFAAQPAGLDEMAGTVQDDGSSGLVWNRLSAEDRRTPIGHALRRAALADVKFSTVLDAALVEVVTALRGAGVEPLLTKGWAVARYYPNPAARPYTDIDLSIRPDQFAAAAAALGRLGNPALQVDLHVGLPDLPDRTWTEVIGRSHLVPLADYPIRVLAPEDQFRWLAVHLVRHEFDRPLWLVDLAVLLEAVGADMDWDVCLRGSFAWRRWLLALVGLAGRLLGARIPEAVRSLPGCRPPQWLEEMVLWRWGNGDDQPLRSVVRRPGEWWPFVAYQLLNPIRWNYRLGLPPVRFLPPIWAASIVGRGIQPYPRLWRALVGKREWVPTFATHTHRTF